LNLGSASATSEKDSSFALTLSLFAYIPLFIGISSIAASMVAE
jgi:hypothetical protein